MSPLLREAGGELPDEYLVSRLRGRRRERLDRRHALHGRMDDGAWPDDEAIEEERDGEIRWLYRQMNSRTREALLPLFLLYELRRFVNWLRQVEGGGAGWGEGFFATSLLDSALLEELKQQATVQKALLTLERRAETLLPAMRGISLVYEQGGLPEVEQQMMAALLAIGAAGSRGQVADLCRRLIDFGNVMRLVKAWLWKLPGPPSFMAAGHLSPARLRRIGREGDAGRLGLPASVSPETITPEQIALLEGERKRTIWRSAREQARGLDPVAVIVEYLCFIEAETVFLRSRT